MTAVDTWTYREITDTLPDISDYGVEAIDGSIGKVDESTNDVEESHFVVDTGPWIFGKKVLLHSGVIDRIDTVEQKMYVNRTKDQIEHAPELDESRPRESSYREAA